jgi:hypothetical protein
MRKLLASTALTLGLAGSVHSASAQIVIGTPGCTAQSGEVGEVGCYVAHLTGVVSSTTPTRLTESSGSPSSTNVPTFPAGFQGVMVINGAAHDSTGTVSYFPGLATNVLRTIQVPDSGPASFTTNAGGGSTVSSSGYSQTISLDTTSVPGSLDVTVKDANADPTQWDFWVTIYANN